MLATPSQAAAAHRELDRIGIVIGTEEYAHWERTVRRRARERTQDAMRSRGRRRTYS